MPKMCLNGLNLKPIRITIPSAVLVIVKIPKAKDLSLILPYHMVHMLLINFSLVEEIVQQEDPSQSSDYSVYDSSDTKTEEIELIESPTKEKLVGSVSTAIIVSIVFCKYSSFTFESHCSKQSACTKTVV